MLKQVTKSNAGSIRERALRLRWRLHHVLRSGSHCKKHYRQYRRRFHAHSSSTNWLILLSNRQEEVFVLRNSPCDRPPRTMSIATSTTPGPLPMATARPRALRGCPYLPSQINV